MLCHYLTPKHIVCPVRATNKSDVIELLTSTLCQQYGLKNCDKVAQAILAREKVGSTFLPIGVAIPHARYKDIEDIQMVMGIIPEGIFETYDGKEYPIHLVFLFVSPLAEQNFGRHLKLLARIAAIFRSQEIVKAVASATDAETAFHILQRFEREAEELQSKARQPLGVGNA